MTPPARPVAIIDIDGVIADARHREHHVTGTPRNWPAFFASLPGDPLLVGGRELVLQWGSGHTVVLLTGRPERTRDDTVRWLREHDVPFDVLLMRDDSDRRPAAVMKASMIAARWQPHEVEVVLDDDPGVIAACRDQGYPADLFEGPSHP